MTAECSGYQTAATVEMGDGRLPPRFWARVRPNALTGCWWWTGHKTSDGYGRYRHDQKPQGPHRVIYEAIHGALSAGLEIDHLCYNPACVNPEHIEAVTREENVRRSAIAVTAPFRSKYCVHGHEFTEANTYHPPGLPNSRACRACHRASYAKRAAKRKAAVSSSLGEQK